MNKLVVGICTCDRPNLVKLCVDSLKRVRFGEMDVEVCMVDSGNQLLEANQVSGLRDMVSTFGTFTYIPIGPVGIAQARNEVLRFSRGCNAKALAFIDDDELAGTEWIIHHSLAMQRFDAHVTTAPVIALFPRQAGAMARYVDLHGGKRKIRPGFRKSAATGNVLLGEKVIKMDITFDEKYRWSGGEDTDFFRRLHKSGIKIYKFEQRDVRELVPRSKACWGWYCTRRISTTQQRLFSLRERRRWLTLASKVALYMLISPLRWCAAWMRHDGRGEYERAHAVGSFLGLFRFISSQRSTFYLSTHDLSDEEMSDLTLPVNFDSDVY